MGRPVGARGPGEERERAGGEAEAVEAAEGRREPRGGALDEPVAGEARDDAAADEGDEEDDDGDAEAAADVRRACSHGLGVEDEVGGEEERGRRDDHEVAPVAAGGDLAGGHGDDGEKEGAVEGHHGERREGEEAGDGEAAGEPEAASAISGRPRVGIRPVQFGMAVKRKPAMTAAA